MTIADNNPRDVLLQQFELEDKEKSAAGTVEAIAAMFVGGLSLTSRWVAQGIIPLGAVNESFHSLSQTSKLFYDFIYSGIDFATIPATPAMWMMLSTIGVKILKQNIMSEKFLSEDMQSPEKRTKTLQLKEKLCQLVEIVDFSANSLLITLTALFWVMDEIAQLKPSYIGGEGFMFQAEDLHSYAAGLLFALLYLIATRMHLYSKIYAGQHKDLPLEKTS